VGYSYVVLRRGKRPTKPVVELGRDREASTIEEGEKRQRNVWVDAEDGDGIEMILENAEPPEEADPELDIPEKDGQISTEELTTHLRSEAYHWPKAVFPPLKRSKHIILDACTAEGKIVLTSSLSLLVF
jgi:ribosomal protein RSM22 (predicted rRNA methylase)